MPNKKFFTLVAITLMFQAIEFANAKTQWLPDYNGKLGSSITSVSDYKKDQYVPSSCQEIAKDSFPIKGLEEQGYRCVDSYSAYGFNCCKKVVCDEKIFPITQCESGKIPLPDGACKDDYITRYKKCVCDRYVYSKTESECLDGSADPCVDDSGKKYYKPENCVTNSCDIAVKVYCGDRNCTESCIDSSGNKKCTSCGGCPEGQELDPSDSKKCINSKCPEGSATDVISCGVTTANAQWTLGLETGDKSGSVSCRICVAECEPGFTDIDECLKGKQSASFCEDMGYKASDCDFSEKKLKCPFDETKVVCYSLK